MGTSLSHQHQQIKKYYRDTPDADFVLDENEGYDDAEWETPLDKVDEIIFFIDTLKGQKNQTHHHLKYVQLIFNFSLFFKTWAGVSTIDEYTITTTCNIVQWNGHWVSKQKTSHWIGLSWVQQVLWWFHVHCLINSYLYQIFCLLVDVVCRLNWLLSRLKPSITRTDFIIFWAMKRNSNKNNCSFFLKAKSRFCNMGLKNPGRYPFKKIQWNTTINHISLITWYV